MSRDPRQARIDDEHLQLLAVLHYVMAALLAITAAFAGFLSTWIFWIVERMLEMPELKPNPEQVGKAHDLQLLFGGFTFLIGLGMAAAAFGVGLSGRFIATRRYRLYCLVVATLLCLYA